MTLRVRFDRWVDEEIGSHAPAALREHLAQRDYRLFSSTVEPQSYLHEVYHPRHGFFRASGEDEQAALRGILMQVWLMDGLTEHEITEG